MARVNWGHYGLTRLPGRSERFYDEATGRTISRRQADKLRGKLSPEQHAKLSKQTNPLRAAQRPARGRQSTLPKTKTKERRVPPNPKAWNQDFFRQKRMAIIQPPDLGRLAALYARIARWSRAYAYYIRMLFIDTFDREVWLTIQGLTRTNNPPNYDELADIIRNGIFGSLQGVMAIALGVGVVFRTL